jgi:hypothetical protein
MLRSASQKVANHLKTRMMMMMMMMMSKTKTS